MIIIWLPSRFSKAKEARSDINGLDNTAFPDGVQRVRANLPIDDNFAQAGARYRWFDRARKDRFIQRVGSALLDPK